MKKLPLPFKLAVLTATGAVVILAIHACAPFTLKIERRMFGLIINSPQPIRSEKAFNTAVNNLSRSAVYEFHLVRNDGSSRVWRRGSKLTIKTDRVITTELTQNSSNDDELVAIGSSFTHHLYSPSARD